MPELAIRFTVELLEDAHAGTGVGHLGVVDDTQSRDQHGRPVVWASALRGLLRETGEDYAASLRTACETAAADELARTLGSALGRAVGDEVTSPGCAQVRSLRAGGEPGFVVWTTTAREVHSRRPQDHTLRKIEYAAAGTVFAGEIRVPAEKRAEAEVLITLLKRLPSLGRGKSRGWGQIRVSDVAGPVALPVAAAPALPAGAVRVRLLLRNLEPLNLAMTADAGNLIFGQSYIPGGRLRAAVLHWLGAGAPSDHFADPTVMRVGNGYVVPAELGGQLATLEVLPLPLSVQEPKGGTGETGGAVPWWGRADGGGRFLFERGERDKLAGQGGDDKRVKTEEYLVRGKPGDPWLRVRPRMGVLMRNAVPTTRRGRGERVGGPTSGDPDRDAQLFSEHVLWEDQHFAADVWFGSAADAQRFLTAAAGLLAGDPKDRSWLRVGRGGRPVVVEAFAFPTATPPAPKADGFTLTLTSDLIARSPWLTFRHALDGAALRELLEDAGQVPPTGDIRIVSKEKDAVAEAVEVHAFNAASGLLRAPAVGIKRGSVFRFAAGDAAAWVTALAAAGCLGERTAEGFGRFILNLDVHTADCPKPTTTPIRAAENTGGSRWKEVVLQRVQKFLDAQKLPDDIDNPRLVDARGKSGPTPAQWNWLRNSAERTETTADLDELFETLIGHASRLGTRAKWKDLPAQIRDAANAAGAAEARRYFVIQLARRALADRKEDTK